MGDAFNPQEILSRLRAKPVNAVSFNGNQGHNNNNNNNASAATATGTVSGASITGGLSTTAQAKGATPVSTSNATTVSAAQKMRAIPAQHPYVNEAAQQARQELEREVHKLQQELQTLKAENKQLKQDKEDMTKHFLDYKTKSDDTIAKLRGKISKMSIIDAPLSITLGSKIEGTGKMYPKAGSVTSPLQKGPAANSSPAKGRDFSASLLSPASHPVTAAATATAGGVSASTHGIEEVSFMEPTFSELMRRNTQDPVDFAESLRRVRGGTGYTNGYQHLTKSHAISIQERGVPNNNSSGVMNNNNGSGLASSGSRYSGGLGYPNSKYNDHSHTLGSGYEPGNNNGYAIYGSASAGLGNSTGGGLGASGMMNLGLAGSGLTAADLQASSPHLEMKMDPSFGSGVMPPGAPSDHFYYDATSTANIASGNNAHYGYQTQTYQPFGGNAGRPSVPPPAGLNNLNANSNAAMAAAGGGGGGTMGGQLRRTTSAPPMTMLFANGGNGNHINANNNNINNNNFGAGGAHANNNNGNVDEYHMSLPILEVDLTR